MVRFHLPAFGSSGIFVHLILKCFSEDTVKATGLFYLVSMLGVMNYPTEGKGVTCRGLVEL